MSRSRVFGQLDDLCQSILSETDSDPAVVQAAYESSVRFAEAAFRAYGLVGEAILGYPIDSVFAVPLRADGRSDIYATDTDAFFPLASREFGVTPEIQLRSVLGVPPSVIETNLQSQREGERGATLFVPLFSTMTADFGPQPGAPANRAELFRTVSVIMQRAAELAHVRLGARVLGLGATLPKISAYGLGFKNHPEFDMSGLATTTGHAGTVHLILETIRGLLTTATFRDSHLTLGIVGAAGSIGWSTVVNAQDAFNDVPVLLYDVRGRLLEERLLERPETPSLRHAADVASVLREANIIVSAVTGPIDLDVIDPGKELDLQSKVIIDDSEPKAFIREQVEARGGYLLNVVGEANGEFKGLRRDGLWTGGSEKPYNFGDEAGLCVGASWGCDIERTVISWAGAYKEAVAAEVTPTNVRNIGRLCHEAGIVAARFQSFSQFVDVP
jgi:hypothetical protein